ncbi:hypothetical protein ASE85_18625 [Sphingobium sp. Leaf26]|uniref:DUF2244 domain-containing protein n=1 Tax=Sphingobium sp. Leaf26 TaxID=1735693 RepID=UPI0006FFDE9D|nr:DUF2244 domain-containing protein [Sphingobium sp. Leaf26]KQN07095.1 hypothetical protein ASE85_18625 [Sphingobium sp. Leaf26]
MVVPALGNGAAAIPYIHGPWHRSHVLPGTFEIHMVAPRSSVSSGGRYLLVGAGAAGFLVSLRFLLVGAWPVLLFTILDLGALLVALHLFNRRPPRRERLRVNDSMVELIRTDGRGNEARVTLPAFWTRLEMSGRSEVDCDLWLVFRQQRHAIGQCVCAKERRRLAPRIRAALAGPPWQSSRPGRGIS